MEAVKITACPRPFRKERLELEGDPSRSVDQHVGDLIEYGHSPAMARENFTATINGAPLGQELWPTTACDPGDELVIIANPTGGDTGKSILRSVAMMAMFATGQWYGYVGAQWLGAGVAVGKAIGTAAGIAASLAVGGLVGNGEQGKYDKDLRPGWQTDNQLKPFAPLKRVYGTKRVWPDMVTHPYQNGNNLYLLYAVGMGRIGLDYNDFKIGDTYLTDIDDSDGGAIFDFVGSDKNVEVLEGVPSDTRTIFPPLVIDRTPSLSLTNGVASSSQATESYTKEIECELRIVGLDSTVRYQPGQALATIAYYDGTWNGCGSKYVSTKNRGAVTVLVKGVLPSHGTWLIRVTLTADVVEPSSTFTSATWETLRCYNFNADPIALGSVASVGIKVPLDKLPDTFDFGEFNQFNVEAKGYVEDYVGAAWTATEGADNCAAVYRDILLSAEDTLGIGTSRIDDAAMIAWRDECDTNGFTFNAVVDSQHTVFDMLNAVGAIGRASYGMVDGKHSVVYAEEKTTPVQIITPRNSYGWRGTKTFRNNIPHALKVRYEDWTRGDVISERLVCRSGYTESTATLFEVVDAWGCNNYTLADKVGWLKLNSALHVDEEFTFGMDIERMTLTRGDMFYHCHDVPMISLGQGRIKSYTMDGSDLESITLDEGVYLEPATYVIAIRNVIADGTDGETNIIGGTSAAEVTISPGNTYITEFEFDTPIAGSNVEPNVGDIAIVRQDTDEFGEYVVTSIRPNTDLGAEITCIANKAEVFAAGTGASYSSDITVPPSISRRPPATPIIWSTVSDETAMFVAQDGTLTVSIVCALTWPPDLDGTGLVMYNPVAARTQVQYKRSTAEDWEDAQSPTGQPPAIIIYPVIVGEDYDIRIRGVTAFDVPGTWAYVADHTVVGQTSPPDAPTDARIENNVLRWAYGTPAIDFAGFEVRMHRGTDASWALAQPLHSGITQQYFALPPMSSGLRTFYVKAVDTSGNYSTSAASTEFTAVLPEVSNIDSDLTLQLDTLFAADTYCLDLATGAVAELTGGTDDETDNDLEASGSYSEMTYEVKYSLLLDSWLDSQSKEIDADQNLEYILQLLPEVTAESWRIEIKYCANSVAFGTSDGWVPLHGEIYMVGTVTDNTETDFRIRVVTDAQTGGTQPKITSFVCTLGYPTRAEHHTGTITGTGVGITGRAFSFNETYDVVASANVVPVNTTSSGAATAGVFTYAASGGKYTGVVIDLLDSSGTRITGDVAWDVYCYDKFATSAT